MSHIQVFKKFIGLVMLSFVTIYCLHFAKPLLSGTQPEQSVPLASVQLALTDKQRGVSWVGGPQSITIEDLYPLLDNHINWIVQTPFGWQRDYDSPRLALSTQRGYWGETDNGLEVTTELAAQLGIQTLLKPHIWLTRPSDGKWRAEIEMGSEQDWQTWFANYRTFILHYATFAEDHAIPIFCIGTELQTATLKREMDWRELIAEIRQVYSGQLTYAANWYQEFESIQFWDALDFIGIQAYFPLTDRLSPSVAELKQGWQGYLSTIDQVQARYNKPVIFTELGYRSTDDAAIEPWLWPGDREELRPTEFATRSELTTQVNCYEAFFQAVWPQEWLAGVYLWKWFSRIETEPGRVGRGFTPQGKPAEQIIAKWYGNN